MKDTFFRIPEKKRLNIIKNSLKVFTEKGYDRASLDEITKKCRISKGGLYEYIESKKDFYIYLCHYCYGSLYNYIKENLKDNIPTDLIESFKTVSRLAINFYIENIDIVNFIISTERISDDELRYEVENIFLEKYYEIFGKIDTSNLKYDKNKTLDLLKILLSRTRKEFIMEIKLRHPVNEVKQKYFEIWDFYLNVLKSGIYK